MSFAGQPWGFRTVYCEDNQGNLAVNSTNINITVARAASAPPGGGAAGEVPGEEEEEEIDGLMAVGPKCGNGICEPGENLWNCPEDCEVNLDTILFNCLLGRGKCNWGQTWFINMTIVIVVIGLFFVYKPPKKKGMVIPKKKRRWY